MKKTALSAVLVAAALALSACAAPPPTNPGSSDSGTTSPTSAAPKFLACMVSDSGGFNDNSFNQSGWEGMQKAQSQLGVQINSAESKTTADFAPNLSSMQQKNCNLTVTVGYLLAEATEAAAKANTSSHFAIIDNDDINQPNVKSLVFKTSDAAFLGGYVAAAYSTTGTVATFGGGKIPSVMIFMDGFVDGVAQYNQDSGKDVKVLGWDKATQDGVFTGDFEDQSKGQNTTKNFIDQGADVIMPVAGPVGNGAAAAAKESGKAVIIWVDADGYETMPQYKDLMLTSVMKEIGAAVYDTIDQAQQGKFSNAPYIGTLANGGVGIAPFHDFDSKIPAEAKAKIAELKASIAAGTLKVTSVNDPK